MNENGHYYHAPVMVSESIKLLDPKPGSLIVDATLGGGGHAKDLLSSAKAIRLIGIDQDTEAIDAARINLKGSGDRISLIKDNFSNIKNIIGAKKIDGILFDLGVSSHQIDSTARGFSFQANAPLDMRMNKDSRVTAQDLINTLDQCGLEKILWDLGEERYSRRIAAAIIKKRPISTTSELADIIKHSIPKSTPINTTKSIARVFQALRIAVNNELDNLRTALEDSIDLLSPKGRIVVISYHSLEDRIVKDILRKESTDCICPPKLPACVCGHKKKLNILTKKPIIPSDMEIKDNPRSRSAKMRAAEKI